MKRTTLVPFALVPLALGLNACGSVSPAGFSSQVSVSGAEIDVTIKRVYDKTTGAYKYDDVVFKLTQPSVSFITQAGSVGGRIVSAEVTVLDASGNRYGSVNGSYSQSVSQRIWAGFACTTSAGTVDTTSDPEACAVANKTPYTRTQVFPNTGNNSVVQLVTPRVGETAAQDCVDGPCPANLHMNIVFNVVDDLNRAQTINVTHAPIPVYRISDTRVEE